MDATLEFSVGQQGEFLATRSSGRAVRADLEDRIARVRPRGILIDFAGVAAMATGPCMRTPCRRGRPPYADVERPLLQRAV